MASFSQSFQGLMWEARRSSGSLMEAGHLGSEECDWLEPCLKEWQALHLNCTILGPELLH